MSEALRIRRACPPTCRRWAGLLIVLAVCAQGAAAKADLDKAAFLGDLKALTAAPQRLAGRQDGSLAAGRYVEKRLREMGYGDDDIYVQHFPVVMPDTRGASLVVHGHDGQEQRHAIYAVRPNMTQASITPAEGLAGQTVYAGRGEVYEYGNVSPEGRIVVLDFDCDDNWFRAFSFGAKAVVFVGGPDGGLAGHAWHHINIPANMPRFYMPGEQAKKLNLTTPGASREVKLLARCRWESLTGRNVIVILRGTHPRFNKDLDEAIVIAAPLDSYSEVPELSPGARDAANCAALLQMAAYLRANRPRRDVILCFFDAQAQNHAGARRFYGELNRGMGTMAKYTIAERLEMFRQEKEFLATAVEIIAQNNIYKLDTANLEMQLAETRKKLQAAKEALLGEPALAEAAENLRKALADHTADPKALDQAIARHTELTAPVVRLQTRAAKLHNQIANTHDYHTRIIEWLKRESRALGSGVMEVLQGYRVRRYELRQKILEARRKLDSGVAGRIKSIQEIRAEARKARRKAREAEAIAMMAANEGAAAREQEAQTARTLAESVDRARGISPEIADYMAVLDTLDEPVRRWEDQDLAWNSILKSIFQNTNLNTPEGLGKLLDGVDPKHRPAMRKLVPEKLQELFVEVRRLASVRNRELAVAVSQSHESDTLRKAVGHERNFLVLHVNLNFADSRKRWGFIHTKDSRPLGPDDVSQYNAIFGALRNMDPTSLAPDFDIRSVNLEYTNDLLAASDSVASGCIARMFGTLNLSAMTMLDPLGRQGLPGDTLDALDADTFFEQVRQFAPLLGRLADDADSLSRSNPINPYAAYAEIKWQGVRSVGPKVIRGSGGGAMRTQPLRHAVVAVGLPISLGDVKVTPPGFENAFLLRTDANGRFELAPFSTGAYSNPMMLAVAFDGGPGAESRGLIRFITTQGILNFLNWHPRMLNASVEVIRVKSSTVVGYGYDRSALPTTAMLALSTALFRDERHALFEYGNILSLYAYDDSRSAGMKLFNKAGLALLANDRTRAGHQGTGISIDDPFVHPFAARLTSHDLRTLIEYRLDLLRNNRISQKSLQVLINLSGELARKADEDFAGGKRSFDGYVGTQAAAGAVARRAYPPVMGVMNDLVTAVVLLLLLTIPFAFSLERLLIGTPHIYRQITWFGLFFLITFGVLFAVNPAFKIAATPIIIFLAFAIIVLSSLVIFIMVRKLQTEIRKVQGLATTVHSMDVSRLSTMMAAVSMGISTMRRRPLRTTLTAATVVLLTFTILTFASFGTSWGNRKTYKGPMPDEVSRVVVRHQLWSPLSKDIGDMLRGHLTGRATVVPRYWVSPTATETQAAAGTVAELKMMLATTDAGRITPISAAVGLDTEDLARLQSLRNLFAADPASAAKALAGDGIFLTAAVAEYLGLADADAGKTKLLLKGVELTYAGTVSDAMAGYTMLEESRILPVNYQESGTTDSQQMETQTLNEMPDMESAQFVTYNVDEVVIVSPATAKLLGGRIRSLNVYPAPGEAERIDALAERIATITEMPTYVGRGGQVQRLIFTRLAEASGWRDLLIPVLLGGLIVFATMLGSVSDREREIYTFSSLGLAPPHVASLFFAESGVYAIVGGMGGYLLGQVVARVLGSMAVMGWLSVPTMNYSSTNAIVTILIVMGTVMISTVFPAMRASRSANPGIQRSWQIPRPEAGLYDLVFPFTVSAYDITGVASFLREHFENFSDTSLGQLATTECHIFRQGEDPDSSSGLGFRATVALAPFDLGVNQNFALMSRPSEIEGINEVRILIYRLSGTNGDWRRANRVFINGLRKQLLIWRTLTPQVMEKYRNETLEAWDNLPIEQVDGESIMETSHVQEISADSEAETR